MVFILKFVQTFFYLLINYFETRKNIAAADCQIASEFNYLENKDHDEHRE